MINPTNLKVALAHLTSRVKQGLIATLSVTFGISMYIFMNGFMTGVNDIQEELAFSTLAHIRVYNDLPKDRSDLLSGNEHADGELVNIRSPRIIQYTEGIINADVLVNRFETLPGVEAITTQVNTNVFFRNGSAKANGMLAGVYAQEEDDLFGISESIVEGSWHDLRHRGDGMVIGIGLAKRLSVGMNDQVIVSTVDGASRSFKIIGIVETTLAGTDNAKAFVHINSSRQLLSKNRSYATDIQINISDFNNPEVLVADMSQLTDNKVESWSEANGQLQAGNDLRNILAVAVSLTILLVAGFGIYNIMNMTVNEKIKEIAILKAMGFEGRDIVEIFLIQSVVIGLLGGSVGMIFGYVVSVSVNNIPFNVASLTTLPMSYIPTDYVYAFVFGLLTTFVAGFLPALKASKVDPVTIIRG